MTQSKSILQTTGLWFGLWFIVLDCWGVIIPPDRLPLNSTWHGIAGVPGEIPNRTNIFVNVLTTTNLNYKCIADGVTDNFTAIENAINDCPSNQVIYLPTGRYRVSAAIINYSGGYWTLRGDGQGKTIIHGGGNGVFNIGGLPYGDGWPAATPIIAGATNGSTSITVWNTTTFAVGQLMWLEQTNDGITVFGYGANGGNGDDRLNDGTRLLNMRVMVTNTDPDVTQSRVCVSLDSHQWSNNIVGNILGSVGINAAFYASMSNTNIVWVNTTPLTWLYDPGTANGFSYSSNVIFRLGYSGSGNNGYDYVYSDGGTNDLGGLDSTVRSNTIIHGNWDYASQSIVWSPSISDTNIPNNYYLAGKPSWGEQSLAALRPEQSDGGQHDEHSGWISVYFWA
jgi:hypothetical protein